MKHVAIVGFGKLGLLHTGVFNALPDWKVGFIVDTSSTMLSMLKSKMPQIQTFGSHTELLAKHGAEIRAAVIATPSQTHVPIALDFAQQNIPMLIEKPLSISADQAEPLVDLVNKNSLVNRVGYMSRFIPLFSKAKSILSSEALGRLQSLRSTMYIGQLFRKGKGWRYSKEASGGGVLITQNSHLLDLLTWLLGDVAWVSAQEKRLYSTDVEDEMHCYFGFKSGLTGFLDSSWSKRHHRTLTMSIEIQGENGTLSVSEDDLQVFLSESHAGLASGWTNFKKPDVFKGVFFDVAGPQYSLQAEEFIRAVDGTPINEIQGANFQSSLNVQRTVDAIYRSATLRGQPIDIKLN